MEASAPKRAGAVLGTLILVAGVANLNPKGTWLEV